MKKTLYRNTALMLDGYKTDHRRQYPEGTTFVHSNLTARSSNYSTVPDHIHENKTVWFGLSYYIQKYLIKEWNDNFFSRDIEDVVADFEEDNLMYVGPNEIGSDHIRALHNLGYLPLRIKALPEGSRVPIQVPPCVFENTHDDFFWLTNATETYFSTTIWGPITSATTAHGYRSVINYYANLTGGSEGFIPIQGHDFSARGMFGYEASVMSGAGHMLSFVGTDTRPAISFLREYYGAKRGEDVIGISVPATEHAVMCMGTKDGEASTFRRLIHDVYKTGIVSIVSDTWNFWSVITQTLPDLKDEIMARDGKVVIRPDCYDKKTEILTDSGWKYFPQLLESDLVAQVDNGKFNFVKPYEIINQKYKGEMVHFTDKKRKVDLLVTPNHRMVWSTNGGDIIKEAKDSKAGYHGHNMYRSAESSVRTEKKLSPLDRFKIAFQADGSFQSTIPEKEGFISGEKSVRFTFTKERKISRLKKICKEAGLRYSINQEKSRKDQKVFYVWLPLEVDLKKDFNWVDEINMPSQYLKDFIDEVSYWDATRRHSKRYKYDSTNESCSRKIRDIATFAGYGALLTHSVDNRSEKYNDIYTVHIMLDNKIGGQSITKKSVDYDGRVYCVKVPSGKVLVRRNDATAVSGNSGNPVKIVCGDGVIVLDGKIKNKDEIQDWVEDYLRDKATDLHDNNLECGPMEVSCVFLYDKVYYKATCEPFWNRHDKTFYYLDEIERLNVSEYTPLPEEKGAIQCLWDTFGGTINDKGFKVLDPHVGLIYGDGINFQNCEAILKQLMAKGFSSDNIVFGFGSYGYQMVTRDTFGMAVKATFGIVNGENREIFKDPKTGSGKKSAKGLLSVIMGDDGELQLRQQVPPEEYFSEEGPKDCLLETVFEDGNHLIKPTLKEIRNRLWDGFGDFSLG